MAFSEKDLKRSLLITGAFYEISKIIDINNMVEWMENPKTNRILAQECSPYLPAEFFDEFADKDPTLKELLCSNLSNFIDSIKLLAEEIVGSYGDTASYNKAIGIKNCMESELKELVCEIEKEELDNCMEYED